LRCRLEVGTKVAPRRLARYLLPPPPPPPPPRGGGGGDPIIGQVFFIVKRKNRVVFNEGNKT
jgi:hypothetical protein